MSISLTGYYGDAYRPAFSSDLQMRHGIARFWVLAPTTGGLVVNLPDARTIPSPGWVFQMANPSNTDFSVEDFGGTPLATIAAGRTAFVSLLDGSTADGVWTFSVGQIASGPGELEDFVDVQGSIRVDVDFDATLTVDDPAASFVDVGGAMTVDVNFSGTITVDDTTPTSNIISPSATGSGTGTLASPFTLRQAGLRSGGGVYWMRGGTYPDSDTHIIDTNTQAYLGGTDTTNRKEFRAYPGETPKIVRPWRMDGANCSHTVLDGIEFEFSDGSTWLYFRSGADDLIVDRCSFHSTAGPAQSGSYTGILFLDATNILVQRSTFLDWWGNSENEGDLMRFDGCTGVTVWFNDWTQARGGHLIINFIDSDDAVIAANVMKNPWTRLGGAKESRVSSSPWNFRGQLWEGNVVYECSDPTEPDNQSQDNIHRCTSYRPIVRNNIYFSNFSGLTPPGHGDIAWALFSDSRVLYKPRAYHNTHFDSETGGISIILNTNDSNPIICQDLRVINCVIRNDLGSGERLLEFDHIGTEVFSIPWQAFDIHHNLLSDINGTTSAVVFAEGEGTGSIASFQSNYPAAFHDNIITAPTFVSGAKPGTETDRAAWYANFALAGGSNGKSGGTHLTRTSNAGNATTSVPVLDAGPFWGGGGFQNQYLGDLITVGGNQVRVTGVNLNTNVLTVSAPISFSSGANVYLQAMGSSTPDLGIWGSSLANGMQGPNTTVPPPPPPQGQQTEFIEALAVTSPNDWTAVGTGDKVVAVTGLNDSTYVETDIYQATQRYSVKSPVSASGTIDDVQVEIRRRKTSGVTGSNIQVGIRLNGTTTSLTTVSLPNSFETTTTTSLTRPGGGNWTVADLSNMEFYFRNINTDLVNQVSRIRLKVTYTP